jgi:uncharacterized protein YqeY
MAINDDLDAAAQALDTAADTIDAYRNANRSKLTDQQLADLLIVTQHLRQVEQDLIGQAIQNQLDEASTALQSLKRTTDDLNNDIANLQSTVAGIQRGLKLAKFVEALGDAASAQPFSIDKINAAIDAAKAAMSG